MGLSQSRKPSASLRDVRTPGHGRHVESPHDLPSKGWLDILSRTAERVSVDNTTVVAAGVAFYAFVAVVPALGLRSSSSN